MNPLNKIYLLLLLIFISCGGKKNLVREIPTNDPNVVQVKIPCSGLKYSSNDKYFRGTGSAVSRTINTAKVRATMNASNSLAGDIKVLVTSVNEEYTKEVQVNDGFEFGQIFESMVEQVIEQSISNSYTTCEELTKDTSNGLYTSYITREVGVDDFLSNIVQEINENDELKLKYDKDRFKEIFKERLNRD
jgi:hypothetical protein